MSLPLRASTPHISQRANGITTLIGTYLPAEKNEDRSREDNCQDNPRLRSKEESPVSSIVPPAMEFCITMTCLRLDVNKTVTDARLELTFRRKARTEVDGDSLFQARDPRLYYWKMRRITHKDTANAGEFSTDSVDCRKIPNPFWSSNARIIQIRREAPWKIGLESDKDQALK